MLGRTPGLSHSLGDAKCPCEAELTTQRSLNSAALRGEASRMEGLGSTARGAVQSGCCTALPVWD